MPKSESIKNLAIALIAAHRKMRPAERDGKANYGSYSTLSEVTEVAQEAGLEFGIVVVQLPCALPDNSSGLETTIMHESGEWISGIMPLLLSKNDPQGQGSGITYARRYALAGGMQIRQEDDDGQRATESKQRNQQPRQQSTQQSVLMPECPQCGSETAVDNSKQGTGYHCFKRLEGCGASFDG